MGQKEFRVEMQHGEEDLPRWREYVLDAARRMGFGERDAWGIVSAVFEACANAVHHGCKGGVGRVALCIRTYANRFEAVVQDAGSSFTCPSDTPIPPATSHRGRGIPMMRAFMDEVKFESDDGCRVTLTKYLPRNVQS